MIYTIKCRRGHCGSQYCLEIADHNLKAGREHIEENAKARGWIEGHDGAIGWLCPFDAPKPAAEPVDQNIVASTFCSGLGCCNASTVSVPTILLSNGWHLNNDTHSWICPACWKTTQPEPAYIQTQEGNIERIPAQCDWSIEEVRGVAVEVFLEKMRELLDNATCVHDKAVGETSLEALRKGLLNIEMKGCDDPPTQSADPADYF